jgi:S1-C subfamily serine protease
VVAPMRPLSVLYRIPEAVRIEERSCVTTSQLGSIAVKRLIRPLVLTFILPLGCTSLGHAGRAVPHVAKPSVLPPMMVVDSDDNELGVAVEKMMLSLRIQVVLMRVVARDGMPRPGTEESKAFPRFVVRVRSTDLDTCVPEGSRQMHFHVEVTDEQSRERIFLMRGEYGCRDTLVENLSSWFRSNLDLKRVDLAWVDSEKPGRDDSVSGRSTSGSGFFITSNGYVVTNAHVVKGASQVEIRTRESILPATVIKLDEANDLALLKVDGTFTALPIGASRLVKLGTNVATLGYPNPDIQGASPKLARGEVASLFGVKDDVRHFQISVPVQPGNSGGPLFDMKGNVVGVIVAKLNAFATLERSGSLPENVNYAVKSSYLTSFLESVPGASNALPEAVALDQGFEAVVERVAAASVAVFASN